MALRTNTGSTAITFLVTRTDFGTSYTVKKGGEVLRIRLATVTPLGHYKSVTVGSCHLSHVPSPYHQTAQIMPHMFLSILGKMVF